MVDSFVERMRRSSHLAGTNVAYIEDMYEIYLDDANNVPAEWRDYFHRLPRVEGTVDADVPHSTIVQHFERP